MSKIFYKVPFFSNTPDNTHCFQAALKMVLGYFEPEKEYSWAELEEITAKVNGLWTWPFAGLIWLKRNGYEVKNVEHFDYREFVEKKEHYLIDLYGKEVADIQIAHSEMNQEYKFAEVFISEIKPTVRIPTVDEICDLLEQGYLVICNINAKALNDKGGYAGHFIVVIGYDEYSLIIHDPGLPSYENRKVTIKTFERAWAYPDENAKNIMAIRPQNAAK